MPRNGVYWQRRKAQTMEEYKEKVIRRAVRLTGYVQGVGLRWRAAQAANALGVTGRVRNEPDGSVSLELQGTEAQIDGVILAIERGRYVQIEGFYAKTVPTVENEYAFTAEEE